MTLINLHRHSRWSLLDGSGSGDVYAKRAVELGQPALALTDHGTLAGALEHLAACLAAGIWPIMGCEVYMRENRLVRELVPGIDKNGKAIKKLPKRFHLTLLAMNFRGWLNLQRLTSEAYATGLIDGRDKPCVDWDVLARYNEGIYCLGGCFAGILGQAIITHEDSALVDSYVQRFRSIFGDRLSLEIMPHDFDDQRILNVNTINVANQHGIPIVATGDTHYPFIEWASTQEVILKLNTGQTNLKQQKKRESGEEVYSMHQENPTLYLMGEQDMLREFMTHHPQIPFDITESAIQQTSDIISGFTPFLLDRDIKMPKFTREILAKIDPLTAFEATDDPDEIVKLTLRRWAREGLEELKQLYPASHWEKFPVARYEEQIEHELATFDKVGNHCWRYMLMVAGEIRYARSEGIIVGPGRGSAAGSTVAYLIGITDIDPISYDLMFERFTNENRKGMPDIDIDFMPGARGRDKVQAHTASVYDEPGSKNVINIAAYGTYGPKAALRAVCRVFDDVIDYQTADQFVKVLDALKPTDKIDLEECADRFEQITEFKKRFPMLWEQAVRIEGDPYTQSVHASGVLVKPTGVEVPTAMKFDSDDKTFNLVTAWPDTRELLANYGFLKIDYLVIDGLVRQFDIMNALAEREGTIIDLRKLPVRWDPYAVEPEVMDIFQKGMTLGIWQFEGRGTIPVLKSVKPDNMHDIAAINALIRPGPRGAGMTEEFAKRKNGIVPITYWHDSVEPVLRKTYGLMIYQEQMMEIAVQLGDFTRTEADDLRKAMGKKYREGKQAVIKFLDELGYGIKFKHNAAQKIGEQMAVIVWEDKCLSFGEYAFNASHAYAYGLISYHDAKLKLAGPADFYAGYLSNAKSKDIPMKLAGSMREGARFGTKIRPPDINNSGANFTVLDKSTILYGLDAVKEVGPTAVTAIFDGRPYRSYQEFEERCAKKGETKVNKKARKSLAGAGAFDAFGMRSMMSEPERAVNEEAYIGVKLSGKSELETYAELIENTIHTEDEFDEADHGEHLCVGGEVIGVKPTRTKAKGEPMGFVTLAYGIDSYRITCFPPVWSLFSQLFVNGKVLFFEGHKEISDQYGPGFIGEECIDLATLVVMKAGES
jgi:DNA polymerase-3 subunit alpha